MITVENRRLHSLTLEMGFECNGDISPRTSAGAYNLPRMKLFESFNTLNRSWDERVVEHQSVRKMFVWMLISLLVLGADASLEIYQAVRLHRFDWSNLPVFIVLGIICFRYSRIIYRRL
jgi:hypothetical protein